MRYATTLALVLLGPGVACGCHDHASGSGSLESGTETGSGTSGSSGSSDNGESACVPGTLDCECGPAGCEPGLVCGPEDTCVEALVCGNGVLEPGEACDDGNLVDFDGCNANCIVTAGEEWSDPPWGTPGPCDDYLGIAHSQVDRFAVVGSHGRSSNPLDNCQIILKVFEGDDSVAWDKVIDPGPNCDEAWGVDFDADGNIWVAGRVYSPEQSNDQWVGKYDPAGNELWTKTFDGGLEDYIYALEIDPQGRAIIAGARQTAEHGFDLSVSALTADGALVWSRTLDRDGGNDIALDVTTFGDEIYVGGFVNVSGQDENAWAARFTSDGDVLWTHEHNGSVDDQDRIGGVARAANGDLVIAGFETTATNQDIWLRRLSPTGEVLWTRSYDDPVLEWADRAQEVAIDDAGNIVVVGQSWVPGVQAASFDAWMRKYDASGEVLWTLPDVGFDRVDVWFAVDTYQDSIYVAGGLSIDPDNCTDAVVRRYSP